jgi:alkylation response protein AidB-like acyl-CoA dehydrogenase
MSESPRHATEQEARAVAEAAREKKWEKESFMRSFFEGRFRLDLLHPHPEQDPDEARRGEEFLEKLRVFVKEKLDGEAIDREGHVPEEVLDGLRELGAFGIKIPREYGGLGLSQVTYNRALALVASGCASTGAFLSAHQSIGVPQPLTLFGTEEQKRRYLPRLAAGALSAFALTEPEVGSDPANLATTAEPAEDGSWILNGEKLWCTNGPRSELMVVMARTPPREGVKARRPITAFIVESDWEGVEVEHICHFMGLRGISNGVMRFRDVKVPAENVIWGEGQGLKLALITLNTGRLSLPAFCASAGKGLLEISRKWAAERVQWGQAIGKHDAIAQLLGRMAADTFAMEAGVELASALADRKELDIRLEAAITKLWHTEVAWRIADDALQIRGGRGYETAESLRNRGELPLPVEQALRDLRINRIFEGSTEIMHLFIAREALDTHLSVAGDMVDPRAPTSRRLTAAGRAALHYAWWYPSRWIGWGRWPRYGEFGPLARHIRFVDRTSRRLSRSLFHAMVRHGPALEKRQAVLARAVDVGAEAFMMTAACVRARKLVKENPDDRSPEELADVFCRQARRRIHRLFGSLFVNDDQRTYRLARSTMDGTFAWLEEGVVGMEERIEECASGGLEWEHTPEVARGPKDDENGEGAQPELESDEPAAQPG